MALTIEKESRLGRKYLSEILDEEEKRKRERIERGLSFTTREGRVEEVHLLLS